MTIFKSRLPDVTIPEVTVTEHVLRQADRLADKPAFIDGPSGRTLTYGAWKKAIQSLAGGLAKKGVGPGTTWALMAPNVPEYAVVFHGLAWAGVTVTTLNPTYGAEEIAFQLKDAKATAIVTVGLFLETAREAAKQAGFDEIYLIGDGDAPSITTLMGEPMLEPAKVDLREHNVVLPYSSGTTGFPKGVELTHRNLVANMVQSEGALTLSEGDVGFAVLPFFHIYGMNVLMNYATSQGATLVTVPRFDLPEMLELIVKYKMTHLYLVPPIVLAMAKHPIIDKYDLSSVKEIFSGAAPLSGELAEAASKRVGCSVAQGYGMTELSPVTHAIQRGDYKAGSVGTLLPNTECRLVDPETGEDQGIGGTGELWIRGPQVMKGYLNNEEATRATIDKEGWLHTGDIATLDEDEHFYIVDRLKELIKYKGFQVPPAELEALIVNLPGVADCAVIGVPDDEAGELPKAFVVKAPGSEVTAEHIQAEVAKHVAHYKQVRIVEFIDAIPKSSSGKILRRELRNR